MAACSVAQKASSSLGRTIKTVTVIGGGLMGSGIAQASLVERYNFQRIEFRMSRWLQKRIIK